MNRVLRCSNNARKGSPKWAPMKVTILKGSHEIGGNCIQLSSGSTTLLLDAGLPLSSESQPVDLSRLSVDALLVSHPHQDHFGLMATLPPGTPVYIGRLARSLIDAPQLFIGKDRYALNFYDFQAWQPFTIGDFTITPYLVDHSATDAYAFLIEAEGKRLFYSGDLRSHGRKGILFENLVKHPIRDIDVLFLEGTMLHRSNDLFPDETAVEETIFQTIRQQKNISFLLASSQTRTEWHRVYAWGNLSNFAKTLLKGQLVSLEGKIKYRTVEEDVEGKPFKHTIAEIHASSMRRLT